MPEVSFQVPRILSADAGDRMELQLTGETVHDLLCELKQRWPRLYRNICNERDVVRQHINLFVNDDLIDCRETPTISIQPGDVVSVFQAVSGG